MAGAAKPVVPWWLSLPKPGIMVPSHIIAFGSIFLRSTGDGGHLKRETFIMLILVLFLSTQEVPGFTLNS
jgi:hypothetical protein